MNILVFSDTHGKIKEAKKIIENNISNIDMVVHLGDYLSDAKELEKFTNDELSQKLSFIYVGGNMDEPLSLEELYQVIETPYGKALLTHGHDNNVKASPQNLLYKAEEMCCNIAMFGHTHSFCFEKIDNIYLINPGSLTRPRVSNKGTSLILKISESGISHTVHYIPPQSTFNVLKRGSLFDKLNNSDRF